MNGMAAFDVSTTRTPILEIRLGGICLARVGSHCRRHARICIARHLEDRSPPFLERRTIRPNGDRVTVLHPRDRTSGPGRNTARHGQAGVHTGATISGRRHIRPQGKTTRTAIGVMPLTPRRHLLGYYNGLPGPKS